MRRGWSQERLGALARLHRNYVGTIERGEANGTILNLLRVVRTLGVPLPVFAALWDRYVHAGRAVQDVARAR